MRIRNLEAGRPGVQRILLGAGLGTAFGLQACRLADYLSRGSLPRFGLASIFLSHVLLGVAIAATAAFAVWWKRGLSIGLLFAAPCAALTYAIGWERAGAAQAIAVPLAGLLIAFFMDLGSTVRPSVRRRRVEPPRSEPSASDTRQRLSQGQAELERLESERRRRGDPRLGKSVEDRIIWGELLELEIQNIDERVSRTGDAEGGAKPRTRKPRDRGES
jgi:hypothetical protein